MKNLHYLCVAGSYSYGINTETSDLDIRGWYFPEKADLLGLRDKRESVKTFAENDITLFSFHKFIQQLTQCNPNSVEWIGVRPEFQLYVSPIAKYIIDHPEMFLSKRVFHTFSGYAHSMLKQIESGDITHRNRKSAEKLGKHMVHLIRLYYTGINILETGRVDVYLENQRELLLAIRRGELPVDKIYELRNTLLKKLQVAYDNSVLPNQLNFDAVNNWVVKTTEEQMLHSNECYRDIQTEVARFKLHAATRNTAQLS